MTALTNDASTPGATREVRVRYFAAAGEAAGTEAETLVLPADATVDRLREEIAARHGAEMARLLGICALLLDGRTDVPGDARLDEALGADARIDVLPPFAGG